MPEPHEMDPLITMTNSFALDMSDLDTRKKVVLLTIISGLTIEIMTGMKVSRGVSPIAALKRDFNFTGRTKVIALNFAVQQMMELDPQWEISPRILKAMAK